MIVEENSSYNRNYIINVSSLSAFLIIPKNATYSGTKAFLKAFSESLHLELVNTGVKLQMILVNKYVLSILLVYVLLCSICQLIFHHHYRHFLRVYSYCLLNP